MGSSHGSQRGLPAASAISLQAFTSQTPILGFKGLRAPCMSQICLSGLLASAVLRKREVPRPPGVSALTQHQGPATAPVCHLSVSPPGALTPSCNSGLPPGPRHLDPNPGCPEKLANTHRCHHPAPRAELSPLHLEKPLIWESAFPSFSSSFPVLALPSSHFLPAQGG